MAEKNIFSVKRDSNQLPSGTMNISKISAISGRPDEDLSLHNVDSYIPPTKNPFANKTSEQSVAAQDYDDEFANEPSLLEELDIDLEAVKSKLKSTLFFFKPDPEFAKKPDLTGPLILATILGFILTLVCSPERPSQFRVHLRPGLFRMPADLLPAEHDQEGRNY